MACQYLAQTDIGSKSLNIDRFVDSLSELLKIFRNQEVVVEREPVGTWKQRVRVRNLDLSGVKSLDFLVREIQTRWYRCHPNIESCDIRVERTGELVVECPHSANKRVRWKAPSMFRVVTGLSLMVLLLAHAAPKYDAIWQNPHCAKYLFL